MPIESENPVVVPARAEIVYNYIGFSQIAINWPDPNGQAAVDYKTRMFGYNPDTQQLEWGPGLPDGSIYNLFTEAQGNPVIATVMQLMFFELEGRVKNLPSRMTPDLLAALMSVLQEVALAINPPQPSSSSSSS